MKTYAAKAGEIRRQWYVVDASKAPLGRVATAVANLLIGKHKPSYTPNLDGGDSVAVVNSDQLRLTGNKLTQKMYYRHSGYPGSLKEQTAKQLKDKDSKQIIELAVKGMLPKNKLQASRMARLRVTKDDQHGLEAQKPQVYEVKNG